MSLNLFFHSSRNSQTTLSEIRRVRDLVDATEFCGLYAYATRSGPATFDLEFGSDFWDTTSTRWLFGMDYGRTEPEAVRQLCERPNTEVRIYDGDWVVDQTGFVPRRDFHPKTAFLIGPQNDRCGVVTGSGNFSSNGLRRSLEAGAAIYADIGSAERDVVAAGLDAANELWGRATPAESIVDAYLERWRRSFSRAVEDRERVQEIPGARDTFWIETGYVTKNRGPSRPGNQIDLPRGMAGYFGLNAPTDLARNSVIGEIAFLMPAGDRIVRNIRLGSNGMEKITLPIPETHGFDIYDGKVLVFQRAEDGFRMSALEAAEFQAAFGDRLALVMTMGSGRRYGHIE